jgi:hypothetical protein
VATHPPPELGDDHLVRAVTKPDKTGRQRALLLYPDTKPCEVCGKSGRGRGVVDRHHRDSDRMNNAPENIAFLCRKDHLAAHRNGDGMVGGGARPRIAAMHRANAIERSNQAREMSASGASTREIASAMGVDPWTVLRWFSKYPA